MYRMALSSVVVVLVALASIVFVATGVYAFFYAPDLSIMETPVPVSERASVPNARKPVHLEIPSLHIDANVQQVGINKKGDLGTPHNFKDVAWYTGGPAPGQEGSAVIDGHVDNGLALPGVFKHLGDAKVHDDVYVVTEDGSRLHFLVIAIESYPYNKAPRSRIFTRHDGVYLNLITCAGVWIGDQRTYDKRLVVYTELQAS